MTVFITLAVSTVIAAALLRVLALRKNIAEAKATGLPYVIVPFFFATVQWALLKPVLLPLFKLLPEEWTKRWLPLLEFTRGWHNGYKPFDSLGTDTFIAVSPERNVVFTCDPDVSAHFLRGPSFGKPQELLGILNIYGPTMTGTDGAESRLYRKTTAPFFTERTMQQVWIESVKGADALLKLFAHPDPKEAEAWTSRMRAVMSRLTLYVLNAVCFEGSLKDEKAVQVRLAAEERPAPGHRLTYSEAMHGVLDNFDVIFFTPRLLLDYFPLRVFQKAKQAYRELGQYMQELRSSKEVEIKGARKPAEGDVASLLDLLVRAGSGSDPILGPAEVLGNIFIFMFAGHEANANTLTFLLLLLACNPDAQRAARNDVDRVFLGLPGTRNVDVESAYEEAFAQLMEGYVGACINEALRLYTVIPFLVKTVPGDHVFNAAGSTHHIPGGSMVLINTTAVHRHPQYWPDESHGRTSPVDSFDPKRWLRGGTTDGGRKFLHPKPGTFMPFSDGGRGCLGKRFALVELCAVVSRILSLHSIELISDGKDWDRTRKDAASALWEQIEMDMSLRLTGSVPIRFVKRGEGQQKLVS